MNTYHVYTREYKYMQILIVKEASLNTVKYMTIRLSFNLLEDL